MLTVNGKVVLAGKLGFPLVGAFQFLGQIDEEDSTPPTPSLLAGPGLSLSCAAWRTGNFRRVAGARLVGGAGGLGAVVPARGYHNGPTLELLLRDIATDAGETLSATIDPAVLGRVLPRWTRLSGRAATALLTLVADQQLHWRVLDDGTIWVGVETWPASPLDGIAQVLSSEEGEGRATLGVETCTVRPGTTLGGRRVTYVEYSFAPAAIRAEVEYA